MYRETPCKCTGQRLSDHLSPSELANKQKELAASLERFEKRRIDLRDVYNQVEGSSPISYPAHGVYCRPRRTVRLKGVRIDWFDASVIQNEIQLTVPEDETQPSTEIDLSVSTEKIQVINATSQCGFNMLVSMKLYRYTSSSNLKRLIASIHELYPGTRMVIADDTPSELFTSVQAPNVDHFRMPEKTGYFAGRNLGLSQVSTEYFVYADDDHFIRNDTRLDMFVSLLDKTNFHLYFSAEAQALTHLSSFTYKVSSKIEDESWRFSTTFEITGDNGDSCLVEQFKTKHFHEIPGFPGKFQDRVTVVVKTFLRYSNLKRLIASIHELYPGTRMVIADDTPSELFTSVQAPNVDHFRMPEKTGYFAGRNLGLSQVSTEYFVYADDDHFIRNDTRLDMFVSLLDKTNFHLVNNYFSAEAQALTHLSSFTYKVSSKIEDESWRFTTTFEITGDNGDSCLVEQFKTKHFHEIPGFPGCYANEKGENFFMASTNEMKSIGFDPDPALSRIGHEELFFSALGRLRTAACRNNVVGHNRTGPEFKQAHYERFRRPGKETKALKSKYSLLKHNLACTQIGPHRRGNRTEAKPKK
uniref:Glycosyltransferase 2-like domain-containing protein n=1 Tax=Branchiostoma floridae TaxID=7739 RepID=C3ZSG7_BRAFL|eukprot:XP_002588521.1 hypothetical protein BRAFLDRAFT_79475 [Branchiostoma floridae]